MKPTWGRPDLSAGLALLVIFCVLAAVAQADTRDQAKRIHDRIAGVPPDDATLTLMADDIERGDPLRAALRATEAPEFYGVTLKNFAAPWTNREGTYSSRSTTTPPRSSAWSVTNWISGWS
jgi:hypothetical protein